MEHESLRIVHLTRLNRLKRLASRLLASRSGVRLVTNPAARPNVQPFRVDPELCRMDFELMESRKAEFREAFSGHPLLEVTSESLQDHGVSTLEDVQRFLGVSPTDLSTRSVKIAPENVQAMIENYADLKAFFAGTRFEKFSPDSA